MFKIIFGHISAANCPISVKFCMGKQNSMARGRMTQTENFVNSRWRLAAILKIVKSQCLDEKTIQFWWNLVHNSRYQTRWQSHDNNITQTKRI